MVMYPAITEHVVRSERHTTFYLACGPQDGPLVIFLHGWPELSISWRRQLPCLGDLGFRAVAPDMRGYGRSTVYSRNADYQQREIVRDMLELIDRLGRDRAIWVGHDWGAPVGWTIASHHPERCHGVANLCVPYLPGGFVPSNFVPLADRSVYPEDQYPVGQWDYQFFYEENFDRARSVFEADVDATVTALFRKGNPDMVAKPSRTADVRRQGGWFGGRDSAPPLALDTEVLSEQERDCYVAALERNSFFGPDSWYMNHKLNAEFAKEARNAGRLSMPVLFLHALYDLTCETTRSRLAEPMRAHCDRITEAWVPSGHWMAQERPSDVNSALVSWIATEFQGLWPKFGRPATAATNE